MAGGNNFMQDREAQIVLYGITAAITAWYAVDAVRELVSGGSAMLIEQVGQTAYLVLTVARLLVCVWASVSFGRMAWKTFQKKD